MWEWPGRYLDDRTRRFHAATGTRILSWGEVLALWTDEPAFCDSFTSLLAGAPWDAFRWETPPLVERDLDEPFEFVVIDSPELGEAPEPTPFAEHFRRAGKRSVVHFPNLGADAQLVVPCPIGEENCYAHLARFVRGAPEAQQRALWHQVGLAMARRTSEVPVWLNTAGSGVAWLHVRLDDHPKYYAHAQYRRVKA